jgi:hypothetical protein
MQRDSATYCEEPADAADFAAWRAGFASDGPGAEARAAEVLAAAPLVAELQERFVPQHVAREDFWARYFYRWGANGAA